MRNNIRFLNGKKLVYNAAALGIVLDIESNTQEFFNYVKNFPLNSA
jgi:hypothetical protein